MLYIRKIYISTSLNIEPGKIRNLCNYIFVELPLNSVSASIFSQAYSVISEVSSKNGMG